MWYGRRGKVRRGESRWGKARNGLAGKVGLGLAWKGEVWQGEAWRVKAGLESQKGVDVEVGRNGRKAVLVFSQQVQSTC